MINKNRKVSKDFLNSISFEQNERECKDQPKFQSSDLNALQINTEMKMLSQKESKALMGLRGLAAFHLMVFHSLIYSKWQLNLIGSPQMSLFYVLSGFFLSYTCGKVRYATISCCVWNGIVQENEDPPQINVKDFYLRRAARILPLYYITNLASMPLLSSGYGFFNPDKIVPGLLLMLTNTSSWIVVIAFNGASWFVSTIWFFYWVFPLLLPKLQSYSIQHKLSGMKMHFWMQIILGISTFAINFSWLDSLAFYPATMSPITRFPVFIMGVLAGLIRLESSRTYKPSYSIICCLDGYFNIGWAGSAHQ